MTRPQRFPDGTERRAATELRAVGRQLQGIVARFNNPALIGGTFHETILPGAFRASLAKPGADILALVDHDPGRLLARTGSGTLRLNESAAGLEFSLDVPDTGLGHDVLALAERGDIGGMSFGFRVVSEAWPKRDQRELREVDLMECSIVHSWPAYSGTEVNARSRALAEAAEKLREAARQRRRYLETL